MDDKDTVSRTIFVNLPVRNLGASMEFFTHLGFRFNPAFTDDKAACMVLSETAFVMLLTEDFYATFVSKAIADTSTHNEVVLAISAQSREEVNRLVGDALAAGGSAASGKIVDGPMYGWSFADVDGHLWEVLHMDVAAS